MTTASASNSDDCIPPLYDVAFPVVPPSQDNIIIPRQIPPQGNWQDYDTLPFEGRLMAIRPKQHELWFSVRNESEYLLYRYFTNEKQWKSYEWDWHLYPILVSSDDTVWSGGKLFLNQQRSEEFRPLLGRFDDATGRFEYVKNVTGFLQEVPQERSNSNFVEDQSGLVWFFTETDKTTLVSLDVKTGQSQKHYSFDYRAGFTKISIGSDGSVWFWGRPREEIIQYILSTGETHTYAANPGTTSVQFAPQFYYKGSELYMDHSGRLWMGGYAWLDFSKSDIPEWYRVIESPVFVSDRGMPDSQYTIYMPPPNYQSSNGWYWFTQGTGILRLDLPKGEWCLMSTGDSEIFEDDEQNLWIAVFGHLYKYQLQP